MVHRLMLKHQAKLAGQLGPILEVTIGSETSLQQKQLSFQAAWESDISTYFLGVFHLLSPFSKFLNANIFPWRAIFRGSCDKPGVSSLDSLYTWQTLFNFSLGLKFREEELVFQEVLRYKRAQTLKKRSSQWHWVPWGVEGNLNKSTADRFFSGHFHLTRF